MRYLYSCSLLQAHALPFLTHLDASYCPLPSAVVVPLARDVTRLKELALNGCAGVDDSLWRAVATRPGLPPPPPSPPPSPPGQQRRPGSGAHRRYSDRAGRYGHGDGGPGGCAARGSSMGMDRPRAGVATRRQRLGMDAVYDRDAGGFGGASGSGGWQLTLAGPRRLGDVSARGAGGPSGLGSPTRRRHAGATAGPASAPTLFPASGAQAGGGRAAAGGDMTSLAVTLSLLSSEAEDEAMGPPAASVFFDSGANSDDGEDGPGPMGRPWGSQEDRRAKGGSSAAAASCAGGATAARSCGAGGAGTQPAVPYGGGVRAGHARSTALAALPESLPASQLERLSLVRCTALKSLCLGLMPLQEQQQQLQNVDRAGVVWWPPPQQLAQASGPGCGWVPVGCVLSNLRSLRLGLSAVQVRMQGVGDDTPAVVCFKWTASQRDQCGCMSAAAHTLQPSPARAGGMAALTLVLTNTCLCNLLVKMPLSASLPKPHSPQPLAPAAPSLPHPYLSPLSPPLQQRRNPLTDRRPGPGAPDAPGPQWLRQPAGAGAAHARPGGAAPAGLQGAAGRRAGPPAAGRQRPGPGADGRTALRGAGRGGGGGGGGEGQGGGAGGGGGGGGAEHVGGGGRSGGGGSGGGRGGG